MKQKEDAYEVGIYTFACGKISEEHMMIRPGHPRDVLKVKFLGHCF